jgi:tellurite resistance protein
MFLSTLNQQQQEAFLNLAHNVVVSDGDLTTAEDVMMQEMRKEMALASTAEAHYVDIDGVDKIFDTKRSRVIVLISLIQLGYADGAFEVEEKSFIRDLCRLFDISIEELNLFDNWVRRLIALEREALHFM